jgi:hypothetical protein
MKKRKKKTIRVTNDPNEPYVCPWTPEQKIFRAEVGRLGGPVPYWTQKGDKYEKWGPSHVILSMNPGDSPTESDVPTTLEDLDRTFLDGDTTFFLQNWKWEGAKTTTTNAIKEVFTRSIQSPTWGSVITAFGEMVREADDHHGFIDGIAQLDAPNEFIFYAGS